MKELKVISLENGVILSENLVKGSILPRTSAELERDVLIQNDTIVEGAVYARKLEIQNGDVEILGAVFTKLEFHISNNAKGDIILRKRLCKLNCVMLYSHLISSVGDRPAPRGGTTRPDERKITTI